MTILNTSGYYLGSLPRKELPRYREMLLEWCSLAMLRGTILVTPEGLNIMLAGSVSGIHTVEEKICALVGAPILFKHSESTDYPFNQMLVKIKKEVIAFGVPVPLESAPFVEPKTLKRWLDNGFDDVGRPLVLLDTRNDYEVSFGTFAEAIDLKIGTFRAFSKAVCELDAKTFENKTVVTFCTGGIRCEKAAPFLKSINPATPVYQLEGGILNYLKCCGAEHWVGECFVFDERLAVDTNQQAVNSQLRSV